MYQVCTTGLLAVIESDDELSGVMGHELAHSELHHGRRQYVDGVGIDSCHVVWFELHEDLLATLGIDRSAADRRV